MSARAFSTAEKIFSKQKSRLNVAPSTEQKMHHFFWKKTNNLEISLFSELGNENLNKSVCIYINIANAKSNF